jgi:hypothetical protein
MNAAGACHASGLAYSSFSKIAVIWVFGNPSMCCIKNGYPGRGALWHFHIPAARVIDPRVYA